MESGPRGAAEGATGTGRAVREEGRGSGEDVGKRREAGVPDVGRIGVVGEVAISESEFLRCPGLLGNWCWGRAHSKEDRKEVGSRGRRSRSGSEGKDSRL